VQRPRPPIVRRSIYVPVDYDRPDAVRATIDRALGLGVTHVVLGLPSPYPDGAAGWVAGELLAGRA
jgi:hypothetical protein